ncbi:exopolysaccharide biosynthesis polyprenyl glycosylphosphotransferase [Aequitasia blattaphilus]|uniref:Sugar transferase n=1 Tax=Aequitasia blattaphilus TaxID=2949332 RepID=A0ABT1E8R3_9FIRM|nr:sugar transferase [Aequitasia blattaphilus]MCP1101271.1 sugar transferase [Aequitasia blattaphilus]MCR8613911.1 sugar transferase [Aequitasia blattaphilus]
MYKKTKSKWLKHLDFMLIDLICLQISFVISYLFYFGWSNPYWNEIYQDFAVGVMLTCIIVTFLFEPHKNILKRSVYTEISAIIKQVMLMVMLFTLYLFVLKRGIWYSRIVVSLTFVLFSISIFIVRMIRKVYLLKRIARKEGNSFLFIVTSTDLATETVYNVRDNNYGKYRIDGVAIIDGDYVGGHIDHVPIVADGSNLLDYILSRSIDEVLVCLPDEILYRGQMQEIVNQITEMGVIVHLKIAELQNLIGKKQSIGKVGNYTVLTTSVNIIRTHHLIAKRVIDIIGGVVGCLITGILFIFLAPLIYRKSPGPIFFSQLRIGKNGRKFKMYKFRSMYLDAEERKKELLKSNKYKNDLMFKMDYDPRIIDSEKGKDKGLGYFIRNHSLDEFPQFYNVLKGDMSLVGTRPPTVDEWEKYEYSHRGRLAIKPGVTGLWQATYRNQDIQDFDKVVELDKKYINEWSFGLDVKILLMTIKVLFKNES